MANPFVHVELNTADPARAKAFYSKLFQWELEDAPNPAVPDGAYTMIKVGEGTGGGMMKQVPGGPAGWLAYVEVDDIHAATQKAKSLGREDHEGSHGSDGRGLDQLHSGSGWGGPWAVAIQIEIGPCVRLGPHDTKIRRMNSLQKN